MGEGGMWRVGWEWGQEGEGRGEGLIGCGSDESQ